MTYAASLLAFASWGALTVTVCGVSQFIGVKVRDGGSTVKFDGNRPIDRFPIATVTSAVGAWPRTTV